MRPDKIGIVAGSQADQNRQEGRLAQSMTKGQVLDQRCNLTHDGSVKFAKLPHATPFRQSGPVLIINIRRSYVICWLLLSLCGLPALAQESTGDQPSETPASQEPASKSWNVGIAENGGLLIKTVGGLYFSQYYNSLDIEYDFLVGKPLWLGVSTGYAATLPSAISESTPLILPAWDSFHTDIHSIFHFDYDWLIRVGLDAWYAKIANVQLYMFFLGTDLSVAKQFKLGPIILEPGIVSTWQFRRDPGLAWVIGARLRILY